MTVRRRVALGLAAVALGAGTALLLRPHGPAASPRPTPKVYSVVPLPAVIVNLDGADGVRYLKVQVSLVMRGPMGKDALAKMVADRTPALLDGLIWTFEGQRYDRMRTAAGFRTVTGRLRARFGEILAPASLDRLYFAEFARD